MAADDIDEIDELDDDAGAVDDVDEEELDEEDLSDDLHVDEDDDAVIGTVDDEIDDEDEKAEAASKAAKPSTDDDEEDEEDLGQVRTDAKHLGESVAAVPRLDERGDRRSGEPFGLQPTDQVESVEVGLVVVAGPSPDLRTMEQPLRLERPDVSAGETGVGRELVDRELAVAGIRGRGFRHSR